VCAEAVRGRLPALTLVYELERTDEGLAKARAGRLGRQATDLDAGDADARGDQGRRPRGIWGGRPERGRNREQR
jgi:hypothetical protein